MATTLFFGALGATAACDAVVGGSALPPDASVLRGDLTPASGPGPLTFDLGAVVVKGPSDGAALHFDNVIFDEVP